MEYEDYEINVDTLLLLPIDYNKTKVIEKGDVFIDKCSTLSIIKKSCLFFGSSYEGRKAAIKYLIGIDMKVPILIEESRNIIFFPTASCVNQNSIWVSYQNLLKYSKLNDFSTVLYFKKNKSYKIDVKYKLVDNQVIRCMKLNTFLGKRKSFIENDSFDINF